MAEESAGAIVYTVDMETDELLKSTEQANKSLDAIDKGFDKADKSAAALQAGVNALGAEMAALSKSVMSGISGINALNKNFEKTDKSLEDINKRFDSSDASIIKLGASAQKSSQSIKLLNSSVAGSSAAVKPLTAAIRNVNSEAASGISIFGKFGAAVGTFAGIGAAQQLLKMTESYGEMSERIRMATSSQEEFEMVQQRLLASANETYRSLKETQEIYIRTSSSLRSMGYETAQLLEVTESFSLAMVKSATSQERAQIALGAFSRALAKGRTDSDAWEMMLIAIPSLAEDMGRSLNKTAQEVRQLGVEGKITTAQLTEGLRDSLDENREAAAGMAVTVKDAYTQLTNNLSVFLGEANKSNEVTATMSLALQAVGKNISDISKVLAAVGVGALAAYIAKQALLIAGAAQTTIAARTVAIAELNAAKAHLAASNAALVQATSYARLGVGSAAVTTATNAQIAATTRLAAAQAGAAGAGRLLLGALGGPVGIIALAATAAAGLYLFGDSAETATPEVDDLTKSVADLNKEQRDLFALNAEEAIRKYREEAEKAKKVLDDINLGRTFGSAEWINKQLVENAYNFRVATDKADGYQKRLDDLKNYNPPTAEPTAAPTPTTSSEGQKRLAEMREELAALKLSGEARARLQAIQKLGETATAQERIEAEQLAVSIFKLDEQQKQLEETKRKQKAVDEDLIKSGEQNIKVVNDLTSELAMASMKGVELAQAAALLKLNQFATPEQIEQVRRMTAALFEQEQKLKDIQLVRQLDEATGAQASFDEDIANLQRLNEAKLIEDQRYLELKTQLETEHSARMMQIEEQRFAAQSRTNQLLIDSLNEVQAAGTMAITGLLSGTNNLTDAMQQLGAGILHHAVGSLVEMGIQYVKSMVMGQTAQTVAAATAAATGASMAASYAPAAAMASLASFGANAAPASAGIASTVGMATALSVSGGRLNGGPVTANGLYRVNENGRPEIFNAANGQQYMMPNSRGEVVSNKDATGGAGQNIAITITVTDSGTQTTQTGSDNGDSMALANGIRVVVIDEIERQSRPGGSLWSMKYNA